MASDAARGGPWRPAPPWQGRRGGARPAGARRLPGRHGRGGPPPWSQPYHPVAASAGRPGRLRPLARSVLNCPLGSSLADFQVCKERAAPGVAGAHAPAVKKNSIHLIQKDLFIKHDQARGIGTSFALTLSPVRKNPGAYASTHVPGRAGTPTRTRQEIRRARHDDELQPGYHGGHAPRRAGRG
ncbi:hypothetical protein D9M71_485840 [compost metagenome]